MYHTNLANRLYDAAGLDEPTGDRLPWGVAALLILTLSLASWSVLAILGWLFFAHT